jgi:hypothetical protein
MCKTWLYCCHCHRPFQLHDFRCPSGTTTPTTIITTTTAPAATTTQQLHLVELNVGLGKVGSEHGDLMLGGHQVSLGASGLLHLVEHFHGLKDIILGHLPLVVGRAGWDELLAKHFIVVGRKLIKE